MIALLIAASIITCQIFVHPLIGLADSGDFERFLPRIGLLQIPEDYAGKYFLHFNSKYRIIKRAEQPGSYRSSSELLLIAARWLSIRFGQDHIFDIRILGMLRTAILLFGIWLLLVAARGLSLWLRIFTASLLLLIFTDPGYVAYFNSFYSEGTALIFLLTGIGSSLILATRRHASILLLGISFLAFAMVVASKPAYVPIAPAFAMLGIYLSRYVDHRRRLMVSVILAAGLCFVAAWYYTKTSKALKRDIAYLGIFYDMLPNSATPEDDLIALGMDPSWAKFTGTTPYQSDTPLKDPEFGDRFSAMVRAYTRPVFYLTRPTRLYDLCARCVSHAFSTRVRRLGYYEADSGRPPQTQPFGLWSSIRETVFPRTLLFVGFFFATSIAAFVLMIRLSSPTLKYLGLLYIVLIFVAVVEFFVPVLSQGESDLEKHLFMFNLAFDSCLILAAIGSAYMIHVRVKKFRGRDKLDSANQVK